MTDLRLPFRIHWAGQQMPDLTEFSEPLAIPFWLRPTTIPDHSSSTDERIKPQEAGR